MRNPLRRSCPSEVTKGLAGLFLECEGPSSRCSLLDYTFYATVGRDRRKLTLEWVTLAREAVERGNEYDRTLQASKSSLLMRIIELAEGALHELRGNTRVGIGTSDIDKALAALAAVRSLTKGD